MDERTLLVGSVATRLPTLAWTRTLYARRDLPGMSALEMLVVPSLAAVIVAVIPAS